MFPDLIIQTLFKHIKMAWYIRSVQDLGPHMIGISWAIFALFYYLLILFFIYLYYFILLFLVRSCCVLIVLSLKHSIKAAFTSTECK